MILPAIFRSYGGGITVAIDYEPFAGPKAQVVRRTVARFPGRTAKDIASLAQVSAGHVYVVLATDVDRGRVRREKDRGAFVYWPVETVVIERPLCIDGEFYDNQTERVEVPRDRIVGL